MAVRTVQQINQELGSVYNPQIKSIQAQKATIPMGVEADIKQAEAAQTQSFDEIMGGARRRGMGFSGIPLSEQAKYASTVFAPEVLRARQRGKQQELSLADALNSIYERRNNQALALQQQDVANDQWGQTFAFEKEKWAETLRQQAADRAAAARAAASSYGGGLTGGGGATSGGGGNAANYRMVRNGNGYAFTDHNGKPISAATYASAKNIPFRTLLSDMAKGGDTGARDALGFVGDDFGYNPNKVNTGLYNALTWGYRPNAVYSAPAPSQRKLFPMNTSGMRVVGGGTYGRDASTLPAGMRF
jgi:hypothetical protein